MTRLTQAFWVIAAIDALLLIVFLALTATDSAGAHDGGRAMALFFFGMVPAVALVLAALLFHFSTSTWAKAIALFVVAVPGLYFAKVQIEDRLVDRQVEANRRGVGYFDSEPMRLLAAAVVERDVATLMRLGRGVDLNAPGHDMTLMQLAVRSSDARLSDGSELPVVRALLALGAKPDDAMETACYRSDSALLETLLAAGANPNLLIAANQPLVFRVMGSITPGNFRLLAAHGLDLNSTSYGDPLPVQLTIYQRWDLLAIAIELGADVKRARRDGRNVADELRSQIDDEAKAGHAPPADLLRALALL